MSVFRVGMRVRKVRGVLSIGMTGVVDSLDVAEIRRREGYDLCIRHDGLSRCVDGVLHPAGTVFAERSSCWEPILDRPELSTWDEVRKLGIDVHAAAETVS